MSDKACSATEMIEKLDLTNIPAINVSNSKDSTTHTKNNSNLSNNLTGKSDKEKLSSSTEVTLIRCNSDDCESETLPSDNIRVSTAYTVTKILFKSAPQSVLLIKKWKSEEATKALAEVSCWLKDKFKIQACVESSVLEDLKDLAYETKTYREIDLKCPGKNIDFCIVIGGDGTYLHLNSLFQDEASVPPVLGLALGSLGFLLPYELCKYPELINTVMNPDPTYASHVILRTRLKCAVFKEGKKKPVETHQVLNEFLLSRGVSPYLTKIEFFVDGHLVTNIQADGVIVSSPTGSTAYSLSAGGTMMPPIVPGILVTPICPHSLSFRPVVLPDSCVIKMRVPTDARAPALASFDGRNSITLEEGDYVTICTSPWPVPSFSMLPPIVEWFNSVVSRLNWNVRELQKPT